MSTATTFTSDMVRIIIERINETIGRVTRCIANDDYSLNVHVNGRVLTLSILATGTIIANIGHRTEMIRVRSLDYIMSRIHMAFDMAEVAHA